MAENAGGACEMVPVKRGKIAVMVREETDSLSTSQPLRLVRRQGQCRDVVQHGLDRQNMLGQSGYIARKRVKVQRVGVFRPKLAHCEPS